MQSSDEGAARQPQAQLERIQREHEISRSLDAARWLEARLELTGLAEEARRIHDLRDRLAALLANVEVLRDGPPCQAL